MTASEASAQATIPPDRATYHHVCDLTRRAYGLRRQLPRVVVWGAGAGGGVGAADVVDLGIATGAATEGALTLAGGAVATGAATTGAAATCAAGSAGCAAVPEPEFATATVPAIVKNEATLSPPRSQRVAAAG